MPATTSSCFAGDSLLSLLSLSDIDLWRDAVEPLFLQEGLDLRGLQEADKFLCAWDILSSPHCGDSITDRLV